ncbi:MAG: helicase C-terminal domain-containing protein [Candidatus Nanopelagicales bacterium]|nr:helicase C-terminal domain-containing protein [Candidatus Nanopelagicales bacterium]
MAWIGERAEQVADGAVDPAEDNMLRISYHGRCAALDPRLVIDPDPSVNISPGRKLDHVADRILAVWRETCDQRFPEVHGDGISPRRGGLQLVFCDLGTPGKSPDRFSAYTELKQLLVDGGIPHDQVRFIHEAGNDMEKARMFAAARDGRIAVLFGSTEKMGVGTNVQHRAVALHHVDPPWRPADVAQRDGRIVRQGNCNSEVKLGLA